MASLSRRLLFAVSLAAAFTSGCRSQPTTDQESAAAAELQAAIAGIEGVVEVRVEAHVARQGSARRLQARVTAAPDLAEADLRELGQAVQRALVEHRITDPSSCSLDTRIGDAQLGWTLKGDDPPMPESLVPAGLAEIHGGSRHVGLTGFGVNSSWTTIDEPAVQRPAPPGLNFVSREIRTAELGSTGHRITLAQGAAELRLPLRTLLPALGQASADSDLYA